MNSLSFAAQIFTFLVCFIVPIFSTILLSKTYHISIKYALLGTLGFIIMQLCIRIPLLGVFEIQTFLAMLPTPLYALILASSAAIFETIGRLLVFKLFFKNENRFSASVLSGIGHGGIEAMTIVGITYINNLIVSVVLFISGSAENALQILNLPQGSAQMLQRFVATPASSFVYAGFERIFTMMFHIFASVLLFYFIRKKRTILGLLFTILIHTALDFTVVMLSMVGVTGFFVEFVIFLFATASLIGTLILSKKFKNLNKEGVLENG